VICAGAPSAEAQQPAQGTSQPAQSAQGTAQQSAGEPQAAQPTRVFASDAGIVLNFIKPDKTADFEMIVSKLKEALAKSDKPERKQQAASW